MELQLFILPNWLHFSRSKVDSWAEDLIHSIYCTNNHVLGLSEERNCRHPRSQLLELFTSLEMQNHNQL